MKKIMIFYGSYGGGHLSAARSIKEYIDKNYEDCETMLVDCIEYINKLLNKVTTKAYADFAKKAPWAWEYLYKSGEDGMAAKASELSNKIMSLKLNTLLKDFNPDLIISTHYFSSQMCAILKEKGKLHCKLATIMTDYEPHKQWYVNHKNVDYIFVAHEKMKEALCSDGVPSSKIFVTGIPLSNRFLVSYDKEQTLKDFGLTMEKTTVLFFAGGEMGLGKSTTYKILESIIELFPDFQVVAIAGKNEKMKERFDEIVSNSNKSDTVKILQYTSKVPELMSVSDLVITKPGGLTTTESLASGLPIVVINPIPGQEEGNAKFLESSDTAIWIKKGDNIREVLSSLFNDKDKLKKMKINARLLAKKNSTRDICEISLSGL